MWYTEDTKLFGKDHFDMKRHAFLRILLRWIVSVGSFWISIMLFPYDFYCLGYSEPTPFMSFGQVMALLGLTALAGTGIFCLLLLLKLIGKWIGMYRHLILLFIYHYVICSGCSYLFVHLTGWIDIQPSEMYALLGFIPALLYSIIYSYERSRHAAIIHA